MSEARFGPFQPPVDLTEGERDALDALRNEGRLGDAATRLGVSEARLRLVLKNIAEKLRIVSSL